MPLVLVPQVAIGALGRMRLLPRYASHSSGAGTMPHITTIHCSAVRCNHSATGNSEWGGGLHVIPS